MSLPFFPNVMFLNDKTVKLRNGDREALKIQFRDTPKIVLKVQSYVKNTTHIISYFTALLFCSIRVRLSNVHKYIMQH